jgi:hypothetical protein
MCCTTCGSLPPSPRAPHKLTVGGDLRFYGNRMLTEGGVACLYQRSATWKVHRKQLLEAL